MWGTINDPKDIFEELTQDCKDAFGKDMISLILYGSAAAGQYVPGQSDLNILIILTEAGIDDLERGLPLVGKWRKRKVAEIFMTPAYISSSLDTFPVEFINMQMNYLLISGEDVLKDLKIEACNLRLELERELKGKIFHLRQEFLESEGKDKELRRIISLSLGSFVPLFKALLYLRGYEVPPGRRDVIKALSLAYPTITPDIYLHCIDIREGKGKFSAAEVKQLYKSYQKEIVKLSCLIDGMEV